MPAVSMYPPEPFHYTLVCQVHSTNDARGSGSGGRDEELSRFFSSPSPNHKLFARAATKHVKTGGRGGSCGS